MGLCQHSLFAAFFQMMLCSHQPFEGLHLSKPKQDISFHFSLTLKTRNMKTNSLFFTHVAAHDAKIVCFLAMFPFWTFNLLIERVVHP